MIMLLDTISERYGMLPSEVINRATTFDVFVADTAIGYRNLLQDRAIDPNKVPNYNQEELQEFLKASKGG